MPQSTNSSSSNTASQSQNAPSVKQRKLQQQYKQNIVQYNNVSVDKGKEKHLNKQQQLANTNSSHKQHSAKKNHKTNTNSNNANSNRGRLTAANETVSENTLNTAKHETFENKSNNATFAKEDMPSNTNEYVKNNERRSSFNTWNLQQKAAMPYGAQNNDSDDDEDTFLSQGIVNNLSVHKAEQKQQDSAQTPAQHSAHTPAQHSAQTPAQHPVHLTPAQHPVHLTPLSQKAAINMPIAANNNNFNHILPQSSHYQMPPFGYQLQQQLGMPPMMQPPPNNNQNHQYRLFLMELQRQQMMGNGMPNIIGANPVMNGVYSNNAQSNNIVLPMYPQIPNLDEISPKIEAISLAPRENEASATNSANSLASISTEGNSNSKNANKPKKNPSNKLKKQRNLNSSDVLSSTSTRQSQYAGTSFGLAAPVLESFPKPSF